LISNAAIRNYGIGDRTRKNQKGSIQLDDADIKGIETNWLSKDIKFSDAVIAFRPSGNENLL